MFLLFLFSVSVRDIKIGMELSQKSKKLALKYSYITKDPEYMKLNAIPRHSFTNTYDHSVRVALASVLIAEKLHMKPKYVVKAALLHDFCLIDYHLISPAQNRVYAFKHPKDAVLNSKKFGLSKAEEKAILSHMFPLGPMPSNKEGWVIASADKAVTLYEKLYGVRCICISIKKKITAPFKRLFG